MTTTKEYYNSIADEYDSKSNKYANGQYLKEIKQYVCKEDSVLELGCGSGWLVSQLDAKKKVGIDSSLQMLKQPKRRINAILYLMDAEHLEFRKDTFDVAYSVNLLEHLLHPEKAIKEAERVLKEGGKLIIITPNGDLEWLLNLLEALKLKIPEGDHHFLTKKELFGIVDQKRVYEYKTLMFGLFHFLVITTWGK